MAFMETINPAAHPIDVAERLFSKADGGGANYDTYISNTGRFFLNSVFSNPISSDVTQWAIPFKSGETPDLYLNGLLDSAFSNNVTVVENDADLQVGRYYTNIRHLTQPLYDVLIFNAELTATQIGILWELWNLSRPNHIGPTRKIWMPPQDHNASLTAQYGRGRTPSGDWLDFSGNGNDGTIGARIVEERVIFDGDVKFHGELTPRLALPTGLLSMAAGTAAGWVETDSNGAFVFIGHVRLAPVDSRVYLYSTGGAGVITGQLGTSVAMASTIVAKPNTKYHVAISWDGSDGYLFVNGAQVGTNPISGMNASLIPYVGTLTSLAYASTVGDLRIFSTVCDTAAIREIYLQGARKVLVRTPRAAYPETPTTITAPEQVGPWDLFSGTAKRIDNGTRRCILSSVNTTEFSQACDASFGTFVYYFTKDAEAVTFMISASLPRVSWSTAGQSGYLAQYGINCRVFRQNVGGGPTLIGQSAASAIENGVEYRIIETRDELGVIKIYIKGGAYLTDTLLLTTSADLTYTESKAITFENVASTISDVDVLLGAMTPAEYDAIGQ